MFLRRASGHALSSARRGRERVESCPTNEAAYKGCPHQEDCEVSLQVAGGEMSVPSHPDDRMDPPLLMPSPVLVLWNQT